MATKIVFIAACVLAVTANAVRVAQDQDDGYEQQNTDYEPMKTDYEPKKTGFQPKRVVCVGESFLENLFPIQVACFSILAF